MINFYNNALDNVQLMTRIESAKFWFLAFGLLTFMSCKEPYTPVVADQNKNILVVEGTINTGADSTVIKLSRMTALSGKKVIVVESGATVSIESETNEKFSLPEKQKGTYAAAPLNLNPTKKYRLSIKTTKGASYLSDFVQSKSPPPIDSLNWELKDDGVHVYVNTHDDQDKTRYYRWEYAETWIFFANYFSLFKWNGSAIVQRNMDTENVFQCWGNEKSSSIYLGSSTKLSKDVIFKQPVGFVPSRSEKFSEKYSILVKQYALTKEAYEFWESLKKNTESLGSIFDAQPSQLTGNIHNVADPNEPVVGYISAGAIQQKRIFITRQQLPSWLPQQFYRCELPDTVFYKDVKAHFTTYPNSIPLEELDGIGFSKSVKPCADCTLRGTNKRPIFWQ